MKFKSQLVTQVSGSVGGTTYAHNQGGLYMRARAIPTNPNTTAQQAARTAMASITAAWSNTLTATQRADWELYAANTPVIDALGDSINISGIAHYVRSNVPRVRAGLARVDNGPSTFGLPSLAPVSIAAADTLNVITWTWDDTEAWADLDGAYMLLQAGLPQNPGITFYKSPFQQFDTIDGDSTTAPTSPTASTSPFTITTGQRVFGRARLSLDDGRLSYAQIVNAIAT